MSTNHMKPATNRGSAAPGFTHEEHLSRRQAAERLVDIAYALTAGTMLALHSPDAHVNVPVADEVVLTRASTTDGKRVDVDIGLSWFAAGSGS